MKGDGEESGGRDFLSLGSSSRSAGSRSWGEREAMSGGGDESSSDRMLSSLSRNGLSLLAGGATGGFSVKPFPAVGTATGNMPRLRNLVEGKVSGGAFTGFYRASVPKTPWPAGMGLRFVSEEKEDAARASSSQRASSANAVTLEQPLRTDVEALSPDECWRLILKLGKRWPAWNGPTVVQSPRGVVKEKSSQLECLDSGHEDGSPGNIQIGQDFLKLLASRALEALASTPDRYDRPSRSMRPPKRIAQEFLKTRGPARDPPTPTSSQSAHPALCVNHHQQSASSLRKIPAPQTTSSAEPRTAPLTIFYAGTVNVSDTVPEDKAHLIMLLAERARIKPTPAPSASCAPPSKSAAPQESVRPHDEDLQVSQPCSRPISVTERSLSVPSHLPHSATHRELPSSVQMPVESSTLAEVEPPPMPLMVTHTEGNSRQQRHQQGPAKLLPNARKNSLARFLDSKKRPSAASGPEGQVSSKRCARARSTSDGCLSDADDMARGKSLMPLSRHLSVLSDNAEMKALNDSVTM